MIMIDFLGRANTQNKIIPRPHAWSAVIGYFKTCLHILVNEEASYGLLTTAKTKYLHAKYYVIKFPQSLPHCSISVPISKLFRGVNMSPDAPTIPTELTC